MEKVRNIFVNFGEETALIYCLTLTIEQIRQWCEKIGHTPVDIYELKQEELQYYCIDGRVFVDTPEKEVAVIKQISE